jgi:hypothetical protein
MADRSERMLFLPLVHGLNGGLSGATRLGDYLPSHPNAIPLGSGEGTRGLGRLPGTMQHFSWYFGKSFPTRRLGIAPTVFSTSVVIIAPSYG